MNKVVTTEQDIKEMDEDVREEEDLVLLNGLPKSAAVVVTNLTKIYKRSGTGNCCAKEEEYAAVKDLCMYIEEDTLFCLLGPNGAGKTTTIHMLVGFHGASSGDATVFGNSIQNNISQVQSIMGLCPQFDILVLLYRTPFLLIPN